MNPKEICLDLQFTNLGNFGLQHTVQLLLTYHKLKTCCRAKNISKKYAKRVLLLNHILDTRVS